MRAEAHPEETRRLDVLRSYGALDTPREEAFDDLVALAAEVCEAPIAFVSLIDGDRQWFKAEIGLGASETPRDTAICAHTILESEGLEIPDLTQDPRTAWMPCVTGEPRLRAYFAVVLEAEEGLPLGTLCVADTRTRALTPVQRHTLKVLARQVMAQLELRRKVRQLEAEKRERAEGEAFLRLVTDRLPVRVGYLDRDYRYRFMNGHYERTFGLPPGTGAGRTVVEIAGEAAFQAAKPFLDRALAGETHTQTFEVPYAWGKGWSEVRYGADRDESGEVRGVVVHVTDVSERKAAERALREARERLDRTLENACVATFEWDVEAGRLSGNPLLAELFGVADTESFDAYLQAVHPEDRDRMRTRLSEAVRTGRGYEETFRVRRFEGRERWVLSRGEVISGEAGQALRLTGVLLDVTDQVNAERAMRESDARLRLALRGGRMGIWDVDLATNEMVCSDACRANYGRAPGEPFSYDELKDSIVETDLKRWRETIQRAVVLGEEFEIEYGIRWPDGSPHWVQVRGSCLKDTDGRVVALSGVSFDVTERRRAEEALRTSEARYRSLFTSMNEGYCVVQIILGQDGDPVDYRFVVVNDAFERLTGIPTEAARSGRTIRDLVPEIETFFIELYGRVALTGRSEEYVQYASALERWFEGRVVPFGERGNLQVAVLFNEVTEAKRAERELMEREELFRTVFEQAPNDAIVVLDDDRTVTAWNPAAERITGWTAGEALGGKPDMIYTAEDQARGAPAAEIEAAGRLGMAEDERWYRRKDGSKFWGSGTVNALHEAEGQVRGYLKVFRDVTERYEEAQTLAFLSFLTEAIIDQRDAEEILATVERMLAQYIGASRVTYGEFAEDGETVTIRQEWGPEVESMAGTFRVEVLGRIGDNLRRGRTDIIRDTDAEFGEDPIGELLRAIQVMAAISVPILKDGRPVSVFVVHQSVPRDWTDDEISLVQQVADRMSSEIERARAERALQEANEDLEARVAERTEQYQAAVREAEAFNYSISHDLRTPLRAMVSTSSILLEEAGPELTEEHRSLLQRQSENAKRLGRLIDELLRLSRLSRVPVQREALDMTRKARAVVAELEQSETLSGCRVEIQEGMAAEGDPGLVRTVLQNLIGNACKFSPQGGRVRVRQEGGVFSVSDEGVGFDMQFAPKIFQPFERLVSEAEFPGTGIGLANVKRIVERHGGKVWVESEPGKGATFYFTLGVEH